MLTLELVNELIEKKLNKQKDQKRDYQRERRRRKKVTSTRPPNSFEWGPIKLPERARERHIVMDFEKENRVKFLGTLDTSIIIGKSRSGYKAPCNYGSMTIMKDAVKWCMTCEENHNFWMSGNHWYTVVDDREDHFTKGEKIAGKVVIDKHVWKERSSTAEFFDDVRDIIWAMYLEYLRFFVEPEYLQFVETLADSKRQKCLWSNDNIIKFFTKELGHVRKMYKLNGFLCVSDV